jgi:hypothetical protein
LFDACAGACVVKAGVEGCAGELFAEVCAIVAVAQAQTTTHAANAAILFSIFQLL